MWKSEEMLSWSWVEFGEVLLRSVTSLARSVSVKLLNIVCRSVNRSEVGSLASLEAFSGEGAADRLALGFGFASVLRALAPQMDGADIENDGPDSDEAAEGEEAAELSCLAHQLVTPWRRRHTHHVMAWQAAGVSPSSSAAAT